MYMYICQKYTAAQAELVLSAAGYKIPVCTQLNAKTFLKQDHVIISRSCYFNDQFFVGINFTQISFSLSGLRTKFKLPKFKTDENLNRRKLKPPKNFCPNIAYLYY